MVKLKIAPGAFPVAAIAHFSQFAFVRFTFFVTVNASMFCLVKLFLRFMTPLTLHGQMAAPENKIRFAMVECLFVQHNNVRVSSYVFPMTYAALFFVYLRDPPMKAFLGLDIFLNVFMIMAIQALLVLPGLVEKLVAFVAVVFEFLMRLA